MHWDYSTRAVMDYGNVKSEHLSVETANGFFRDFMGLMGVRKLPAGHGMLFPKTTSIHMFFMRIPLDIVWLRATGDSSYDVVDVIHNLQPGKLAFAPKGATSVLELPAKSVGDLVPTRLRIVD